MNSFASRALRVSCLSTRTILRTCPEVDSLAARLARRFIRPYSDNSSTARNSRNGSPIISGIQRQESNLYRLPTGIRTFASSRPVTRFEDLPDNYRNEDGLPYRAKPLSQAEAVDIFGGIFDRSAADRLLRIIHGRRVDGTLEDPGLPLPASKKEYIDGLKWLRQHVPVDEIMNAGLRAEMELSEMEQSTMAKAEELRLYKPRPSPLIYKPNSTPQKTVYGQSGLDKIREEKERAWERKEAEKQARMKQAGEVQQNTGILEKLSARSQVELRRPGENPRLKYYLERAKILPDKPPEMSKFQRLWPSGVVVSLFIGGCVLFASVYTPPRKEWRLWPDLPPSAATILSMIFLNTLVLAAWRFPPMFRTLNKYFITTPGYPFPISLIGNNFSHQSLSHFVMNMAVLWFVGTRLHEEIGRGNFLAIYLACGAFGSFASLTSWVVRNNLTTSSLGASGGLCGIIAAFFLTNGGERVTFFGFPPDNWPSISAGWMLAILIGLDIFGLKRDHKLMKSDHWAHLGGYAAGITSAEVLKMRARQRKEVEMERRKNLGVIDKIREGRV